MPAKTRVAVILVAGVGSRLRPLTDDRPKALVDVKGSTILARAVGILARHGVERVILATGYREDAVIEAMRGAPVDFACYRNDRYDRTQNSVSLALCREGVAGEAFYKLDGDVVFRPQVLDRLDRVEASLVVAVDRSRQVDAEAMKVTVAGGDRIASFGKGIPLAASAGETIGIERVASAAVGPLFNALARAGAAGRDDLYYEDVYAELVRDGVIHAALADVGDLPWTEIDDPDDLAGARSLALDD